MTFSDDFAIIGGTGDDFDCEATTGWSTTGSPQTLNLALNTDSIQGTNAISLRCGGTTPGVRACFHDIGVGDRFKITDQTLNFWFRYSKGKGAAYLTATGTAVIIRLYFGGTTDWANYQLTTDGDDELQFGYQVLQCSGRNLNGGTTSGTWSNTAANWERDIHRVELRLDFANTNDDANADPDLLMDCWYGGTKVIVSEGTTGGTPTTFQDLVDYQALGGTRTGFPLGLINLDEVFATLRCGLDIGNGSDGLNNEGYLQITETFLLFNQWSAQVKHNIVVKNFSQLDFGEGESVTGAGGTTTVAVRGCQITMPSDREDEISTTLPAASDVTVENGGTLKVYASKFFRWRDLFLGAASDTSSTVELNEVKFDTCETVYFRANTLNMTALIEIYNNAANDRDHCAEMIVSPDSNEDLLVHDCIQGVHFRDTLTLTNYRAQNIDKSGGTNYDLAILEGKAVTLVDSVFDPDAILRLTT